MKTYLLEFYRDGGPTISKPNGYRLAFVADADGLDALCRTAFKGQGIIDTMTGEGDTLEQWCIDGGINGLCQAFELVRP